MPPRYAYWTIIVDNQPTAFRSGSQEELMPTFKRLKAKNDSAVMMWWQHGKLWSSRVEAQEAMIAGREIGRRADERQPARRSLGEGGMGTGFRNRDSKPSSPQAFKPSSPQALKPSSPQALKPSSPQALKPSSPQAFKPSRSERPEWKPKGSFDRERKPDWKSRSSRPQDPKTPRPERTDRPEWKPKASYNRDAKPDWKSRSSRPQDPKTLRPERTDRPEWKPKGSFKPSSPQAFKPRSERPDWTPRSGHTSAQPSETKRKWVPKEEYKKSMGIEARRDSKWRPGGEHKDPKQKYKDAKKAKWTKFKQNIRARSGGKGRKPS